MKTSNLHCATADDIPKHPLLGENIMPLSIDTTRCDSLTLATLVSRALDQRPSVEELRAFRLQNLNVASRELVGNISSSLDQATNHLAEHKRLQLSSRFWSPTIPQQKQQLLFAAQALEEARTALAAVNATGTIKSNYFISHLCNDVFGQGNKPELWQHVVNSNLELYNQNRMAADPNKVRAGWVMKAGPQITAQDQQVLSGKAEAIMRIMNERISEMIRG
jgi:hypothetical protein